MVIQQTNTFKVNCWKPAVLQHLPNWVSPVFSLSNLCVAYFTPWHTPVQWHVTLWGLGQFLIIVSSMGKWGWAGTPPQSWTAPTCNQQLQQLRICSPGIIQIFADPRKPQIKKAWLPTQQSHLLDVSVQKCMFKALNIQSLIIKLSISTALRDLFLPNHKNQHTPVYLSVLLPVAACNPPAWATFILQRYLHLP